MAQTYYNCCGRPPSIVGDAFDDDEGGVHVGSGLTPRYELDQTTSEQWRQHFQELKKWAESAGLAPLKPNF